MPKLSAENRELINAAVRDKAYECACAILRDEGFREFTMEKLAMRMGVAKGTIYNYFRNREAVIVFVVQNEISEFAELLRRRLTKQRDVMDFLQDFILLALKRFKEFRFLRIAMGEILHKYSRSDADAIDCRAGQKILDLLTDVISRGMDEGVLRRGNAALTASALFCSILGMDMAEAVDSQFDLDRPEVQRFVVSQLLNGLAAEPAHAS